MRSGPALRILSGIPVHLKNSNPEALPGSMGFCISQSGGGRTGASEKREKNTHWKISFKLQSAADRTAHSMKRGSASVALSHHGCNCASPNGRRHGVQIVYAVNIPRPDETRQKSTPRFAQPATERRKFPNCPTGLERRDEGIMCGADSLHVGAGQ